MRKVFFITAAVAALAFTSPTLAGPRPHADATNNSWAFGYACDDCGNWIFDQGIGNAGSSSGAWAFGHGSAGHSGGSATGSGVTNETGATKTAAAHTETSGSATASSHASASVK